MFVTLLSHFYIITYMKFDLVIEEKYANFIFISLRIYCNPTCTNKKKEDKKLDKWQIKGASEINWVFYQNDFSKYQISTQHVY